MNRLIKYLSAIALTLVLLACPKSTTNPIPNCSVADSAGMQECGGKTLATGVQVVTIYWSNDTIYRGTPNPGTYGAGTADTSLVGDFLRHLGGSPWWNILSTYGIANILNYNAFWANNVNAPIGSLTGSFVSETQIVAMIQSGISGNKIPSGSNIVYVVFTPANVTPISGFPNNGRCADHNSSNGIIYAIIPYAWQTYCEPLTNVSPYLVPNDPAIDNVLTMVAHELAESATDPFPDTGWMWAGVNGGENADRCTGNFDGFYNTPNGGRATIKLGTHDFLVQNNWVNIGAGKCGLSYP